MFVLLFMLYRSSNPFSDEGRVKGAPIFKIKTVNIRFRIHIQGKFDCCSTVVVTIVVHVYIEQYVKINRKIVKISCMFSQVIKLC